MIYLDSSALLKLLHEERESAALNGWLAFVAYDQRLVDAASAAGLEALRPGT